MTSQNDDQRARAIAEAFRPLSELDKSMNIPDYLHGIVSDTLNEEFRASHRKALWAVVLGVVPRKDGNKWFCLYGYDLQVGIVGFGDTPSAAMMAFEHEMERK